MVSKNYFRFFDQRHADIVCGPSTARIRVRPSKRFRKKVVPRQTFAQQHSGDWAMTGKVPVARAESQPLLPAPNRKDENHPAYQDHGRIAGR
jgi:hypothetical protein